MTALAQTRPADPVLAAQAVFRAVMNAMARPGTIHNIAGVDAAPAPMSGTLAAIANSLFDHDTPLWLDETLTGAAPVADWLRFHTGARIVTAPDEAQFALIADPARSPPFGAFNIGTPEYPDRSTTVIFQVRSLKSGAPLTLAGPGVLGSKRFCASPIPGDLAARLAVNRGLFPRGIDLLLIADGAVAALPRSVRLTVERG